MLLKEPWNYFVALGSCYMMLTPLDRFFGAFPSEPFGQRFRPESGSALSLSLGAWALEEQV